MKKIILTVALFASTCSFSQSIERKNIAKGTNGWEIILRVKNDTDSLTFFVYSFQNKKYTQIIDIGSVFFSNKSDLLSFCDALEKVANKEKGSQFSLQLNDVTLSLFDFSDNIYIDVEGKYTHITKADALKMVGEIKLNAHFLN